MMTKPIGMKSGLACLLASATLTAACSGKAAAQLQPGAGSGGAAIPVMIGKVLQKPMPLDFRVIGAAEAYSSVAVHAQITGVLTAVGFKEGDDVQRGEVLFGLDRRPLEAALRQSEANLQRDLAQATYARTEAERYQALAARGIVSREQLDTSTTNAAALEASADADRAAVENATVQLQYATISAPISGRTGALMVHEGDLIRANDTTSLVVIDQMTPINVSFGVPEPQLSGLKNYLRHGSVRVEARAPDDTGAPARGRISFVDNAVDQTTGTIKMKATFPNDGRRFWPGQFLDVVVTLTIDPAAIVVPTQAVEVGPQGQYVFVARPDRTVELRPVSVARTRGAETVIQSGLKAGESVVTDGQLRLVPGVRISVKAESAKGPA